MVCLILRCKFSLTRTLDLLSNTGVYKHIPRATSLCNHPFVPTWKAKAKTTHALVIDDADAPPLKLGRLGAADSDAPSSFGSGDRFQSFYRLRCPLPVEFIASAQSSSSGFDPSSQPVEPCSVPEGSASVVQSPQHDTRSSESKRSSETSHSSSSSTQETDVPELAPLTPIASPASPICMLPVDPRTLTDAPNTPIDAFSDMTRPSTAWRLRDIIHT